MTTSYSQSADDVAVTDALTTLLESTLGGLFSLANIEITNAAGGQALSAFVIQLKDHISGAWYDFLSATDFDSTTNQNMRWASTTGPQELGADATAHVHARINAAYAMRLQAKTASGTATVSVKATFGSGT